MEGTLHELDPDGDVVLIVETDDWAASSWVKQEGEKGEMECSPQSPFIEEVPEEAPEEAAAVRETYEEAAATEEAAAEALEAASEESPEPVDEDYPTAEETPPFDEAAPSEVAPPSEKAAPSKGEPIRMRVSSSHLRLASPYFRGMFQNGWLEGDALHTKGRVEIRVQNNEDPKALLILLNIIHGHTRKVPRSVSLKILTEIAILVDLYECYETVEVFSNMWIDSLKGSLPKSICGNLTNWIWVSWVFNKPDQFKAVTRTAERQSAGPIKTYGLPIPEIVVGTIEERRQDSIDRIISALHDLLDRLQSEGTHCSFECDSILLGALTKEIKSNRISQQHFRTPFLGASYEGVVEKVQGIRSPIWYAGFRAHRHGCDIQNHVKPILDNLEDYMSGLDLIVFPSHQGRDA